MAKSPESFTPKNEVPKEEQPKSNEVFVEGMEIFRHPTEDVVAHGIELCRLCKTSPHMPGCDAELFHKEIEMCDIAPLFQKYENGQIVTVGDINTSIQRVIEAIPADDLADDAELQGRVNLLKNRAELIRKSNQQYVGTLVKSYSLKQRQKSGRIETADYLDQYERNDKLRRIAHDSLIESLNTYARLLRDCVEEKLLEGYTVIEWNMGQEVPSVTGNAKTIVTFAPAILANRDLVKDWAISSELNDMMKDLVAAKEGNGK